MGAFMYGGNRYELTKVNAEHCVLSHEDRRLDLKHVPVDGGAWRFEDPTLDITEQSEATYENLDAAWMAGIRYLTKTEAK